MSKEVISIPNAPNLPFSPGIKAGQFLFVSGQGGFKDRGTGEEIKGIRAQTSNALRTSRRFLNPPIRL